MMNFKFAFVVFLACIALGDAIKCYQCNADRKTGCGKGEVDSMDEIDCEEDLGCLSHTVKGGRVFRDCGNPEEVCKISAKYFPKCISCYEDLCNGSPFNEEDE